MTYTRDEIIKRITVFANGWEKADAATSDFWKAVIKELNQDYDLDVAFDEGFSAGWDDTKKDIACKWADKECDENADSN